MQNKFLLLALSVFLYLLILLSVYLVHINFFKVQVILYSAIFDSLIAVMIFFIFYLLLRKFHNFNFFESFLTFSILILIGYSLSITFPTVVDRSLSFYFLEKIKLHNGSIQKEAMRDIFINDYIDEYKLIEVRITEQLRSGTVRLDEDCIYLTRKGYFVARFSDFFRKNLLANNRLLLQEYSDHLTDPLKKSYLKKEYLCKKTD